MKYISLLLLLFFTESYSQNPGPRLIGMGSGGTATQGVWSLQQNPSGVAELTNTTMAVGYERQLFVEDLSTQTALLIIPYRRNVIGVSLERRGIDEYREQTIGLSYAKAFGESFRLAFGIKYVQLNVSQYGSSGAVGVDAGFQLDVTDKFIIATHITNLNRSRYKDFPGSYLPVKLSIGASYSISDKLLMITDVHKTLEQSIDLMTGIEYSFLRLVSLRGGISINPFKQYCGFGVSYSKMEVHFAVACDPNLGYSPQIALSYEF